MKNSLIGLLLAVSTLLTSAYAHAACALMQDPTVTGACQAVWSACESANVKDAKTGKSGYQRGEWRDGDGLWKNCVGPLAHGQVPPGVTNPPSAATAMACHEAAKTYRKSNPTTCKQSAPH